ncbi:MAG: M20/M25/M40 family metallo-hydrolase [Clostridia bacterium]|nr:M20/M25/M40 family metallo-hydrolase [Clostridia bacterium]
MQTGFNVGLYQFQRGNETGGEGSNAISKALKTKGVHFSMVIDEGGMMVKDPIGGSDVICAAIGVGEKRAVDIKFTAKSHGGHASTPSKNTPLVRLGKFMAEIDTKNVFKSHLSDTLVEAFKIVSPYATGIKKFLFENARKLKPIVEFIVPRVSSTANALFKTTIAFTRAQGSEGNNVLPEEAYVIGNMRCTHYQGLKSSLKAVEKIANKYDISMEVISPGIKSSVSSHETPEYELVKNTINKLFPDVLVLPYIQNGASDSRFFSRVCDNVFRFVPFKVDNEQLSSVHGLNENLNIKDLAPAVEFYKEIIKGT